MDPNGKYPRYVGDIALAAPGWKPGDPLPQGWREVQQSEIPKEAGKKAVFDTPEEIDGVLYARYKMVDRAPSDPNHPRYENMPESLKAKYVFEKWPEA